ncbi:MAG: nucleotidyltransferase domain-containing protein [Deltaproteobacteria bacterium]|nr:nucleotidyltransferase domain-containing protein [Deltaproteobacteria bacterium]
MLRNALPGVRLVYLFGSQAKDRARADSDVDLVDLARASTVMKKEIVAGGRTLYEQSPATRHAFEGQVLSAYARLNEERRPILERIRREGRVHG